MTSVSKIISPASVRKVLALSNDNAGLEKICRNFVFMEELKMEGNLVRLVQILSEALQLQQSDVKLLGGFFIDANLPIEVTLRPLKASQLYGLLQEWLDYPVQGLPHPQSQKNTVFRNALINKVISEQQQTIKKSFFMRQQNGLTHDSIFNLFQQIMANYFLYESLGDQKTFFKKENSFQTFKTILQEFCSQKPQERNKKQIHQHQLEHLIVFWEERNPDLTLSDIPRKFMGDMSVQTESMSKLDHQVQTIMPQLTLVDILNQALTKLNLSIAECSSPKDMQTIERIHTFFKHEQNIFLNRRQHMNNLSETSQTTPLDMTQKGKKTLLPKKSMDISADAYTRCSTFTPRYIPNHIWNSQKKITTSKHSTAAPNYALYQMQYTQQSLVKPFEDSIKTIYVHYYSEEGKFTLVTLNSFFRDIGIRQMGEGELTTNIKRKGPIKSSSHISYEQFKDSVQRICSIYSSFDKLIIEPFSKKIQKIRKLSSQQGRSSTMGYHHIHN